MAIRIQQYNTGPRRIGVGGIDPGYQQPRIGNIASTAENQLAGTFLEAGKALTNVAIKEYVSTETTRVSQSLLAMQKELSAERDRYMAENQGQNAIEAGQHFEKFARETAQKYFQEGGFSGRFAEMFNKLRARRCTLPNRGRRTGANRRPLGKSPFLPGRSRTSKTLRRRITTTLSLSNSTVRLSGNGLKICVPAWITGRFSPVLMRELRKALSAGISRMTTSRAHEVR